MKKNRKASWLMTAASLAVFSFLGNMAEAQERVSLQEAVDAALRNRTEAKRATLQIKKAEYQIDEARAGALPQINASTNLTYNPILQETVVEFGGQRTVLTMGQPWTTNIAGSVSQTIFDQRVFTGLKAAKSTREFYILNADLTNEQIIENVATAYYNVYVQQEKKATLDASYKTTEKVRNIIKSLVDNGLAKSIDLDRTNVQLTNIKANRQQVENAEELAKNALKFYMGIPLSTDIELEDENIEPRPELIAQLNALDERTEIRVLNKRRELLEFNKKATEASLYPTVGIQGNYGWYGAGNKFPWVNGEKHGVFWSDFSAIALNINIPIFSGGANKARIQQAQIDILDMEQQIEETRQSLDLDRQNAITNIENSLIRLQNMKDNVALAEKVQRNTQANYQYGLATLTELLDAENALTQAKQNQSTALLDYKQAEIKFIKANGQLNTLKTP